jgi:heme oxygenase
MASIESASKKLNHSSTHQRLASSVKSRHQSLDQQSILKGLISAGITLPEYIQVMRLLQQCFSLIEPALVNHEKSNPNSHTLPYLCKLAALELDLQQLGADEEEGTECFSPICIDNTGAYLGARYVLEGSTQGAIFIANCLESSLPALGDKAFRFWALQRQAAEHWPAFLATLDRLDDDIAAQEQAVVTAIQSFEIFLEVFAGVTHGRSD